MGKKFWFVGLVFVFALIAFWTGLLHPRTQEAKIADTDNQIAETAGPAEHDEAANAEPLALQGGAASRNLHSAGQKTVTPPSRKARVPNETTLTTGLEKFPIDRELDRFIRDKDLSAEIKKLIVSGAVVREEINGKNVTENMFALTAYQAELKSHQSEFIKSIPVLFSGDANPPPELRARILNMTAKLDPFSSPEVQSLALAEINELRADANLNSIQAKKKLVDSILSYVCAKNGTSGALDDIKKSIDLNDPNQAAAFSDASLLVNLKK